MNGAIIAFDPCYACESHNMCSMCELTLRRDGSLRTDKWISVDERLPDQEGKYLAHRRIGSTVLSYYCEFDGLFGFEHWDITHWMPLPEAPKMRKEDEGK